MLLLSVSLLPPAEAVAAAGHDLANVEPERQAQMRYLVLPGGDVKDRQRNAQAIGYLLNSVSRTRSITQPQPLDAEWQLLRIDLAAYADFRKAATYNELFQAWEQLVESDPYFHLRTQVSADGKIKTVTTDGGWTGLEAAAQFKALSRSFGAVLRADYFVSRVGGQAYYAWAGIPPKEVDFFKLFGVDANVVTALSADSAANLIRSGWRRNRVALSKGRAFSAASSRPKMSMPNPRSRPAANPVDFREQKFNFQASEFFALGANHLWRSGPVRRCRQSRRCGAGQGRQGFHRRWHHSAVGDMCACHEPTAAWPACNPFTTISSICCDLRTLRASCRKLLSGSANSTTRNDWEQRWREPARITRWP